MILEFFSHSGALVVTHEVSDTYVPRIGETIRSPADAKKLNGVQTLIVVDVTYELRNGQLTPVLSCWESADPDQNRITQLRQVGWIPQSAN